MNKKQYATPQTNVVEMENEDMIALSNRDMLGTEIGNDEQFVKDVELPSDLAAGNRNLWDDKWYSAFPHQAIQKSHGCSIPAAAVLAISGHSQFKMEQP